MIEEFAVDTIDNFLCTLNWVNGHYKSLKNTMDWTRTEDDGGLSAKKYVVLEQTTRKGKSIDQIKMA